MNAKKILGEAIDQSDKSYQVFADCWNASGIISAVDCEEQIINYITQKVPCIDINREIDEIPIVILECEDGFTVYPLEIDGVVSQGDTLPQAIHNIKEAISLYIESFGKKRLIPKDERAVRAFVSKTKLSKGDNEDTYILLNKEGGKNVSKINTYNNYFH